MKNSLSFTARMARPADRPAFIDLWKICFSDTPEFVEWFFENRFFPEYSACVETDGVIVCAMQSMPLPLWIRGKSIPGAIVVGVCTHPDFRGRHLMKSMFTFYMGQMRRKGLLGITYKPENIRTYFSMGHYPTTRTLHLAATPGDNLSAGDERIQSVSIRALPFPDLRRCFDLYSAIAPMYSGMVDRNEDLFILKSRDYASVGGKAILTRSGNDTPGRSERELDGYCFYFENEDEIDGEEFCAKNEAAALQTVRVLRHLANGKRLKIKAPSFFRAAFARDGAAGDLSEAPQNVMGISNIVEFVRQLDLARFDASDVLQQLVIDVRDAVIPDNNVRLALSGEISDSAPCMAIGIGYFVQVLCGYRTFADVEANEKTDVQDAPAVLIYDKEKAKKADAVLRLLDCFIVDEY